MRKIHIILFMLLVIGSVSSQTETNISFFASRPEIDGLPDKKLDSLEWHSFSYIEKTNTLNKDYTIHYKIGYNYNYLYLLIESNSDTIIIRDRAYQNGDGFHLVIAKPDSGKPTREFYVLRFSPANKLKNQTARKGVWYYNIDLSGKSLSTATQFACQSRSGKSYFELLLSWNDIYPYHPLFSDSIGINLCFVKAIGENEKNYYYLKYDKRIQWEQNKREYSLVNFERPENIDNPFTQAILKKKNTILGNTSKIRIISNSSSSNLISYYFKLCSADNYIYTDLYEEKELQKGKNTNEFDLATDKLNQGGYKVVWKSSDNSEGEIPFTILPEINEDKEKIALQDIKDIISEGDYNTLLFMLQNIIKEYVNVKEYETAGNIRESYLTYLNYLTGLKKDKHLLSDKKGISRRAFLSKVDNTLQPYSIRIPTNFDRSKKYPLFVMLHGSGADDQGMLDGSLTENNFIEIAPNGRGTSNCFTIDSAEVDVKEAIDDVIKNYPVDTSKIIIAGFSMGGYGAYRVFYQYPKLFKGVVVFSGHPNLPNTWIGEGFPDFLKPEYLKPFKNIPVFIYHSKNDLNCPYGLTKQLVEKLIEAGAKVEFITTTEGGHGIIDKNYISSYYKWLSNTIEK